MKQISRILALLLAVVFMFAMVSCDKDNEANKNAETDNKSAETSADTKTELTEEEYDNLFKATDVKFKSILDNGLSAAANISLTVARDGSTVKIDFAALIDALVEDGVIKQASVQLDTSAMGQKSSQKYYIDGTKLYTDDGSGKYVKDFSDEELKLEELFAEFTNGENSEEVNKLVQLLTAYTDENVKPEYSNPEKDVYVAKYTITPQNVMDIVKLVVDNMPAASTGDFGDSDSMISTLPTDPSQIYDYLEKIKFDNIVLTCTLDNAKNAFTAEFAAKLSLDASLIADGDSDSDTVSTEPAEVTVSADITINDIGEKVTVTAPSDLDSYEEISDIDTDAVSAIFDALFDEEGNMLQGDELNEMYATLVELYGQETVDAVLDYIAELNGTEAA